MALRLVRNEENLPNAGKVERKCFGANQWSVAPDILFDGHPELAKLIPLFAIRK